MIHQLSLPNRKLNTDFKQLPCLLFYFVQKILCQSRTLFDVAPISQVPASAILLLPIV
jgi:hypothetical protein